jgi:CSLREA domain-containing protein
MKPVRSQSRRPLCAAIMLVLCTGTASAATITVTTGGDAVGTASTCTLRQAIASANNDNVGTSNCVAGAGADTILFDGALADSTITLTQGQLSLSTPMTITGSNQTIDANYQSRIFVINSTVTASELTLRHGYPHGAQGYSGGAIIAVNSNLTLSNVVIDHNKTASYGGGLQVNHTALNMTDVTLSNNQSTATHDMPYTGGGININGNCSVTMTRATITGNSSKNGAAIYTSYTSSLTVIDSTISGNTANGFGSVLVTGNSGTVSFIDTTISGNHATSGGGLIVDPGTTLYLVNVTMSGNSAPYGSALLIDGGTATATNSTISGNTASTVGAGLELDAGTLDLANTILSGNTNSGSAAPDDVHLPGGTLTSHYSLLGTALNTAPFNNAANKNVFSDAPAVGPLANNGGAVQTRALLSGSPALNAGSDALAIDADGSPLAYDARGPSYVRRFGVVDIGAFEAQGDRIFASGFDSPP